MGRRTTIVRASWVALMVVVLFAALLLALWVAESPPVSVVATGEAEAPPDRLSPSGTVRGRRTIELARQAAASEPAEAPAERVDIHVFIERDQPATALRGAGLYAWFDPGAWFPSPEEMGLQDLHTADLVDQILAVQGYNRLLPDTPEFEELVVLSEQEGLRLDQIEDDDDPWRRLLALHVESTVQQASSLDVERRSRDVFVRPGEAQLGALVEEALALIDEHPEHPVAEFAWLYALEGLSNTDSSVYSPDEALPLALDLLMTSSDVIVRDAAASTLTRAYGSGFPEGVDRVALDAAIESLTSGGLDLAWLLLDSAVADGDPAVAEGALERYADVVASRCACAQVQRWTGDPCAGHCASLSKATRALLRDGWIAPRTWQDAVVEAVHRCEPTEEGVFRGRFEGRWQWKKWFATPEFRACMVAQTDLGVDPPEGTRAQVNIHETTMREFD